jgi:hypothetical protein
MFPHVPACNPHHTVSTTWSKQEHIPQKPHYTNSQTNASDGCLSVECRAEAPYFPYTLFSPLFYLYPLNVERGT